MPANQQKQNIGLEIDTQAHMKIIRLLTEKRSPLTSYIIWQITSARSDLENVFFIVNKTGVFFYEKNILF